MRIDLDEFLAEQTSVLESTDPQRLAYIRIGVEQVKEGLAKLAAKGFLYMAWRLDEPQAGQGPANPALWQNKEQKVLDQGVGRYPAQSGLAPGGEGRASGTLWGAKPSAGPGNLPVGQGNSPYVQEAPADRGSSSYVKPNPPVPPESPAYPSGNPPYSPGVDEPNKYYPGGVKPASGDEIIKQI